MQDAARPIRSCLAILLAAGEGTRMASHRPKVLHEIGHLSLLGHALANLDAAGASATAVVIGPHRADVAAEALRLCPGARLFVQQARRGTAHAALAARAALAERFDDVLIAFGDTPLVRPGTYARMRAAITQGADVAVLGFEARDPAGYGRLITGAHGLEAIREHKDASAEEREITFCNGGIMALKGAGALALLDSVKPHNAQNEFYLTDAVAAARARGLTCVALSADEDELMGVNDRAQLALAESLLQQRLRAGAMARGATLIAPETVFFAHDTRLGRDVLIEPHVVFGPRVVVEDNVTLHAFTHLEGAHVKAGASVGPYGRLRPGAVIGEKAKVGNFVEIKNADVEAGAKISHLSYIGDARVGAGANIGAGVITCNYDGFSKFHTDIGAGAFIGSNSALVAPVKIGDGAYVGSGSVITKNVAADALGVARGRQEQIVGWGTKFRARQKPKGGKK